MNGAAGRATTATDVRRYFESDVTAVSSPLSAGGRLTCYGQAFLRRHAPVLDGRRILDAGAGLGIVAAAIASEPGAYVVALDFSSWVEQIPRVANPVRGDLANLPFSDQSFETVLCLEVLEHTIEPARAIAEIWRVLRPGGALLLSTPSYFNVAGLFKVVLEGTGIYARDTFAPFDEWKPKVLERRVTSFRMRRALRRQGFRIVAVEGAEFFDAIFPFANRIPGLFANRSFLRVRAWVDRASSMPMLKWCSLHGVFLAVKASAAAVR